MLSAFPPNHKILFCPLFPPLADHTALCKQFDLLPFVK